MPVGTQATVKSLDPDELGAIGAGCVLANAYHLALRPGADTQAWAERARAAERGEHQALFGIVQGSMYPDLRREAARALTRLDLPGYALGGLSVGEPKETTAAMIDAGVSELPVERPRYLM